MLNNTPTPSAAQLAKTIAAITAHWLPKEIQAIVVTHLADMVAMSSEPPPKVCSYPGCTKVLRKDNEKGRCTRHRLRV
jgi:hypothetical protein